MGVSNTFTIEILRMDFQQLRKDPEKVLTLSALEKRGSVLLWEGERLVLFFFVFVFCIISALRESLNVFMEMETPKLSVL